MTNEEPAARWGQDLLIRFRWQIVILLVGLTLVGVGYYISNTPKSPEIQILDEAEGGDSASVVTVEIAGSVNRPGVYSLAAGARIDDLINNAEGLNDLADGQWVEKYLNRAAILIDGQKIYIPSVDEQLPPSSARSDMGDQSVNQVFGSSDTRVINVNTASQKELEELPGIGPVYAQKIIDNRPYSSVEDLRTREVLRQNVFEEIKNAVTVY